MLSANTCVSITAGLLLLGVTGSQAQTCKTEYDSIMRRYNTKCDDGTRSKTEYDPIMRRYDTTIQGQGSTTRCTQEYDRIMRQWITKCR